MANAFIQENRTFKCLQNDQSIDLNDLTPLRLENPNYWSPISYTAKDSNQSEVKLTFTFSKASSQAFTIPSGFKVSNLDASIIFETIGDTLVESGKTEVSNIVARSTSDTLAEANTVQKVKSTFMQDDITLTVNNPAKATTYTPTITEGDKVHITAEQAVDRNIVVDASVTPGVYECISTDYDIYKEKATIDNTTVPLCFKRFIEVTLTDGRVQRVYPWSQKWVRTGDLPE